MMIKYKEIFCPHQHVAIDSNPENPKMIENNVNEKTTSIEEFLRGPTNPPNKMTDTNNSIQPKDNVNFVILLVQEILT